MSLLASAARPLQAVLLTTSLILVGTLAVTGPLAAQSGEGGVERSVVRVIVGKREVDRSSPWQYESVRQQASLAVLVRGDLLLTSAFAIADASLIELQRFGASRKEPADVVFVDYEVNLALLKPKDPKALAGLKAVALGDDIAVDDPVEIYKPRDAYQLARLPASLQEVGVFSAVTSSYTLVSYLLKVQQTGLGWSEPVFRKGELVALTTGQDSDFVHAVPMPVIKHFLDDQHDQGYRGFPSIGISMSSLVSPDQRRLLQAERYDYGVRIARVMPGGPFSDLLQADDVLLEVGGVKVSEHGYYAHPRWGKMHLKYLLNQRYAGDRLKLRLLRGGVEKDIEAVLDRFDSNRSPVVAYRYDTPEPHLIFSGLIFQELSQDYLKQWGKDWDKTAPLDLLYTLEFADDPGTNPNKRFIFLNRILADVSNRGYESLRRQIVARVNGREVNSLADLKAAFAEPVVKAGRRFARIEFTRDGGDVILAYDDLEAVHARLARTYAVLSPESFYSPK